MIALNDKQSKYLVNQLVALDMVRPRHSPKDNTRKIDKHTFLVNGKFQKIYTKISEEETGREQDGRASSINSGNPNEFRVSKGTETVMMVNHGIVVGRDGVRSVISDINETHNEGNMSEEFKDFNSSHGGGIIMQPKGHGSIEKLSY